MLDRLVSVPVTSSVSVVTPNSIVASYSLSDAVRKRTRRVARPHASGSTPVASGSSVPVCPIRFSPSTRRATATTSWDVRLSGLSTTRTPSISGQPADGNRQSYSDRIVSCLLRAAGFFDLLEQLALEHQFQIPEGAGRRATRGVLVSAAAELLGDRVHIHLAFGAHADAPIARPVLFEEDDPLDLFYRQRKVDQPLRIFVGSAGLLAELLVDVHGGHTSARVQIHPAEHRAEQLQPSEVVAVEDCARDRGRIDARFD